MPGCGWLPEPPPLLYCTSSAAVVNTSRACSLVSSFIAALSATCSLKHWEVLEKQLCLSIHLKFFFRLLLLHAALVAYFVSSGAEHRIVCVDFLMEHFLWMPGTSSEMNNNNERLLSRSNQPLYPASGTTLTTRGERRRKMYSGTCPPSQNDFTFSLLPRHESSKVEHRIEMQNSAVERYLGAGVAWHSAFLRTSLPVDGSIPSIKGLVVST